METLEHTASIVWKAIQLGNLNILSPEERDRLLQLREKFNLSGRVTACSTENYNISESNIKPGEIDDELVQKIAEQVLNNLKNKLK